MYNVVYLLQGRANLPPEKVPWDAFRTLLSQCIYGGKIDNEFDQVSIYTLMVGFSRCYFFMAFIDPPPSMGVFL